MSILMLHEIWDFFKLLKAGLGKVLLKGRSDHESHGNLIRNALNLLS